MDLKEIQNLIKFVAKSGASEVKLEMDDVKITIRTGSEEREATYVQHMPFPNTAPIAHAPAAVHENAIVPVEEVGAVAAPLENANHITIKSPIIGTFYRKPSPEKPNFIEVGDEIKEGDVLCMIEAMKLFNEIESEVSGKVVKILVDEASPVEFDQPLFIVDPS